MSKVKSVGLIVEDDSDFDSLKILIQRIVNKENLKIRKSISNGCGKLRRKAASYAVNLTNRGCNMIIVVHDLDRNNHMDLKNELEGIVAESPAKYNFICIPIEEIEAWFLSDPKAIKDTFHLDKIPNIKGQPESIKSPKEYIEEIVFSHSNKTKRYINTKHNRLLSANISLDSINDKCSSFKELNEFLLDKKY